MNENGRVLCTNRKVNFAYTLEEKYEAGIVLYGDEVKSLRLGRGTIVDSYAYVHGKSVVLLNLRIAPYHNAPVDKRHDPMRPKNLLLHARQIAKLHGKIKEKSYTLVVTKIYLNHRGLIKVELALAKGRQLHDRRAHLKQKDLEREQRRCVTE